MSANPTQEHLDTALYICHYLIGTHDYLLVFNGNSGNGLIACTDSDWAGSPEDSKSTTGFYIKLANAVFLWNSHQQKTVALSSTVMILFLGSTLFLISSFHATSPFPGSLCYVYHHYLLILGPLTFTVHAL